MVLEDDIVTYARKLDGVSERDEKGLKLFLCDGKIFAAIELGTSPLRVQTRCDRKLSKTLQDKYESVMESRLLGRNGIEIICAGQLSNEEIIDLLRHGYEQSRETDS